MQNDKFMYNDVTTPIKVAEQMSKQRYFFLFIGAMAAAANTSSQSQTRDWGKRDLKIELHAAMTATQTPLRSEVALQLYRDPTIGSLDDKNPRKNALIYWCSHNKLNEDTKCGLEAAKLFCQKKTHNAIYAEFKIVKAPKNSGQNIVAMEDALKPRFPNPAAQLCPPEKECPYFSYIICQTDSPPLIQPPKDEGWDTAPSSKENSWDTLQ